MTHEEQKAFLEEVYKEVSPMIPVIDRILDVDEKNS